MKVKYDPYWEDDSEDEREILEIVTGPLPICPYCKLHTTKANKHTGESLPCKKCYDKRTQLFKYGLTLRSFYRMLDEQRGRCAICNELMVKPSVDHCHDLGHVRGLLCGPCNFGIGAFRDNPTFLKSAILYLNRNLIKRVWWIQMLCKIL